MPTITGQTRLLAVLGHPIAHSLSPVMHNRALAEAGIDAVYIACPVRGQDLAAALVGLAAIDLLGFSVTIPHKQAIVPLLAQVSDVAQAVGAVNTVGRSPDGGWYGTNTNVAGFVAPLGAVRSSWDGATAVILGSGGAARAVIAGCAELGFGQVQVVGRDGAKLQALAADFAPPNPRAIAVAPVLWAERSAAIARADLLVNATPLGMAPQTAASPLSEADWAQVAAGAIAYDLIYTPRPTQFLREAAARGLGAIDGLEMLVQQGAAAWPLWLGRSAPVEVMRAALEAHLDRGKLRQNPA